MSITFTFTFVSIDILSLSIYSFETGEVNYYKCYRYSAIECNSYKGTIQYH